MFVSTVHGILITEKSSNVIKPGYFGLLKIYNFSFLNKVPLIIFHIGLLQPLGVKFSEVNNINVGLVHRLDVSHARVDTQGDSTVDSCDSDPVTRLNTVHKVIVSVQYHRVRGLTSWHVLCKQKKWSVNKKKN